jgi:outer membrane lipoprotein-sorting protein/peroxiredoxin
MPMFIAGSWLVFALAAGTPGAAPAAGAEAPTAGGARAIASRVQATYRALTTYQFDGVMAMTVTAQAGNQTQELPFRTAASEPGRLRIELTNPMMQMMTISDGKQSWLYAPQLGQYTHTPAGASSPGMTAAIATAMAGGTPLVRYRAITSGLKSARMLSEETVEIEGRRVPCYVIEASYASPPDSGVQRGPTKYWIDKARHLVLRDDQTATLKNPKMGGLVELRQVTTFRRARVNEKLPDTLFTFRPPPGTRKVDQLELPGMAQDSELEGKPAPDFTLANLAGKNEGLSGWRGKVVLLDFWATWCAPCRKEMPTIAKLSRRFQGKGLVVVGINVGESAAMASRFANQFKLDFPILLDPKSKVADQYGASAIPTLVIIDRQGNISSHLVGLRGEQDLLGELKKAGVE